MVIAQQKPFGYHARWIFDYDEAGFQGLDSLYHEKDTLYLGENWQYLRRSFGNNGNMLVQTVNDTVFWLQDGQKVILYDFNAGIGQSWGFAIQDTGAWCKDLPTATVVSTGFDTISGVAIPYQIVEDVMDTLPPGPQYRCSSIYCLDGKISKRMGRFDLLLQPDFNACNGIILKNTSQYIYNLRCFQDDSISINFTQHSCKTGIGLDEDEKAVFSIFPNPATDYITLQTENKVTQVEIYNLVGQLQASTQRTDLIEMPTASGLYIVKIWFTDGSVATNKLVRQ